MVWWIAAAWALDARSPDGLPEPPAEFRAPPIEIADLLPPQPVVNGTDDTRNIYDNAVAIGYGDNRNDYGVFCTGSLIHERWVLTASHCLGEAFAYTGYGLSPYIYAGASERNYEQRVRIRRVVLHPQYVENGRVVPYDIGLVELDAPITGIPLMVLSEVPPEVGTRLTFVGYGVTSYLAAQGGGTKRYTQIPVNSFWQPDYYVSYDPNTNICSGDSGGPSLLEFPEGRVQFGVNRSGASYNSNGEVCVDGWNDSTRVDLHLDWIRSYVPDVLTDFPDPSEMPPDDEPPPDLDVDFEDPPEAPDLEPVSVGEPELGEPLRPDGLYPTGVRCQSAPGLGGTLLGLLGLVGLSRRSR